MFTKTIGWTLAAGAALGLSVHLAASAAQSRAAARHEAELREGSHIGRRSQIHYRKAAPMPATASAGHRPLASDETWAADAHRENEKLFLSQTGFGYGRTYEALDDSGRFWKSLAIRRAELVSLLKHPEPSAYVLEQMPASPTSATAPRRPLDAFEADALAALRDGADAVVSTADPTRFMGAVRARQDCLACHGKHQVGDVLGAFTYYLAKPLGTPQPTLAAR